MGAIGSAPTIVLSSGEMSGDIHAAALVRSLRKEIPGARILALAGERCREAGAELLFHYRDYAILGFTGVLTNLPRLWRLERALKKQIERADLFIAVDYPGLNLRLAAHAKSKGIPVLYYISPQVWAWGAGRMDRMASRVDRMAVILPCDKPLYEKKGTPVEFVGHPFVAEDGLDDPIPQTSRVGIGLLPGSRKQEVRRILPSLLAAANLIRRSHLDMPFTIAKSAGVSRALYDDLITRGGIDVTVSEDPISVMRQSRLLLVASGTATLQGALAETPLVIVYRVSPLNYILARYLITIDKIGLINVILEERVAPELVQGKATPAAVAARAIELLEDGEKREEMLSKFRRARGLLDGGGGTRRVAQMAAELIAQ